MYVYVWSAQDILSFDEMRNMRIQVCAHTHTHTCMHMHTHAETFESLVGGPEKVAEVRAIAVKLNPPEDKAKLEADAAARTHAMQVCVCVCLDYVYA
jgi:hypothetical protein